MLRELKTESQLFATPERRGGGGWSKQRRNKGGPTGYEKGETRGKIKKGLLVEGKSPKRSKEKGLGAFHPSRLRSEVTKGLDLRIRKV